MRHLKSTQKNYANLLNVLQHLSRFPLPCSREKAEDGWKREEEEEEEEEEDPIFTSVFPPAGKGKEVIFNFARPACSAAVGVE